MTIEQTRTLLRPVLADLATLAGGVTAEQRPAPTPCAEFDVAALTGHTVGWLENFAAGFASADGACPRSDVSGVDVPRAHAEARIVAAADELDAAVGAGAAERPLSIGGSGMPGEMALSMILGEYLVHGWDLATATGQAWDPDERAVRTAHEFLQTMVTPESRGPQGMFGAEVPVDPSAGALDRLIGFTGRDPNWAPVGS